MALAENIYTVWAASLVTGVCSMIPQIFVPIASQYSRPEHKGRNVGVVISGLLTGILASRAVGLENCWDGARCTLLPPD